MTCALRVTPAAERDLTAAFAWYESRRPGLGGRFLQAVDQIFERMRERPSIFPEVAEGCRRGLLQRFPYGIYFVVEPDMVVVHAVLHLHRDPRVARRRLP